MKAIARRERVERDGGELRESPSILPRLGIGRATWKHAIQPTSRRFSRELQLMAGMYEAARRRK